MRRWRVPVILLLLGLVCVGFTLRESPLFNAVLGDHAAVPEVSTARLVEILNHRQGVVIDVRPHHEYAMSHIPGAINIWENDLVKVIAKRFPDKGALIVTYCNGIHCGKSRRVAKALRGLGYTNAHRYQLGIPQGAHIISAKLKVNLNNDDTDSSDMDIYAEASDNAVPMVGNVPNELSSKDLTSNSGHWQQSDMGTGWKTTTNFAPVVQ